MLIRPCPEQASLNHCVRPPSRESLTGCPWELLYAVDLMINTESIDRFCAAGKVRDLKIRDGEEGRTYGKI